MAKHKKGADEAPEVIKPEPAEEEHSQLLVAAPRDTSKDGKLKRFKNWYVAHKKKSIPATLLVILLLAFIFPTIRYGVLGLFVKEDYSVTVLDSVSNKPVSEAEVKLGGKPAKTNEKGEVTFAQTKLGVQELTISKKYYKDLSVKVTVALSGSKNKSEQKLEPTGRQVPVAVVNKITGKGVQGVSITVLDAEAKTDEKGEATLVVPVDKALEKVVIKQSGYNDLTADLDVSDKVSGTAKLTITPTGKIYFLSKQSGKIDVVKSNLDGTDRKVVVAGTGKEQESDTILLATRDWKYLALKSRREGDKARLYLIETDGDQLSTIDEGDATFDVAGWQNHDFVYKVNRNRPQSQYWWPKGTAIKSYNAEKKALTTMRDSAGTGEAPYAYASERFDGVYLVDDVVLYTTSWNHCCSDFQVSDKQSQVVQAKVGTTQANVLKGGPASQNYNLEARLYAPNEIYFKFFDITQKHTSAFFEYEEGKIAAASDVDYDTFYSKVYPRFVQSPSGNAYFWAEARDGKSTLFLGDKDAENEQEIASLSEFNTYGWFSEDYLLVSKKDSELYIMGKEKGATPLKITDYHKPAFNTNNYGGGY